MKKFIILLTFLFILPAFGATPPCAIQIEWWLRGQGKFEGASIRTHQIGTNKYEITKWEVLGVDKPTDAEMLAIIASYNARVKEKTLDEEIIDIKKRLQTLEP